jgi:peptidoglycan hydrolase-like protein with peptidoglycan-binding domain
LSGLGQFRGRIAALGGVIVILLGAGSWVALTHASAQSTANGHPASAHAAATKAAAQAKPVPPLRIVSVTPHQRVRFASGTAPLRVQFSTALAADSPLPYVRPNIAGNWERVGTDAVKFVPAQGFSQLTHVRVHIPGGPSGVRSADGKVLTKSKTVLFRTGGYSSARLAELLAQLNYLPVTWAPDAGQTAPAIGDATGQLAAAYTAPTGSYTWKGGYPSRLRDFWEHGSPTGLIVHGAVMAFESDHGLAMDGVAGSQVWTALLAAAAKDQANRHGYSYALASQHSPETLTVWHNGHVVMRTAANTGIPAAPTTVGTASVYLRYQNQIMRGTNPDGSKYADPVAWVAYFRAGEAVHYFPRGAYGYQQSLGCVELPWTQAKQVWPYLTFGTLVTVTGA